MSSTRHQKDYRYSAHARGQLIWTALVALALGMVALEHASTPGRGLMEVPPDTLATGGPLSGADLLRPMDQQSGALEAAGRAPSSANVR